MNLTARAVPYSSTVGGGIAFHDERGRARFQIVLIGTTAGVTKQENDLITTAILERLKDHPIAIPERS